MLRREFLRLQQETNSQTQLLQQVHNQDNYKRQLLADRQKRIQQQQEERRRLENVRMNVLFVFFRLCNECMCSFQRKMFHHADGEWHTGLVFVCLGFSVTFRAFDIYVQSVVAWVYYKCPVFLSAYLNLLNLYVRGQTFWHVWVDLFSRF